MQIYASPEDNGFNAKDIEKIINLVDQSGYDFTHLQAEICENYSKIANLVQSEDSGLSDAYNSVNQTLASIGDKVYQLCVNLSGALRDYKLSTIMNEEVTSESIGDMNKGLDDINSLLNSIGNSGNPMI